MCHTSCREHRTCTSRREASRPRYVVYNDKNLTHSSWLSLSRMEICSKRWYQGTRRDRASETRRLPECCLPRELAISAPPSTTRHSFEKKRETVQLYVWEFLPKTSPPGEATAYRRHFMYILCLRDLHASHPRYIGTIGMRRVRNSYEYYNTTVTVPQKGSMPRAKSPASLQQVLTVHTAFHEKIGKSPPLQTPREPLYEHAAVNLLTSSLYIAMRKVLHCIRHRKIYGT